MKFSLIYNIDEIFNLNIHHFWPFYIGIEFSIFTHIACCVAYWTAFYSLAEAPELLVLGALAAAKDYWQIISRNFGAKRLLIISKIAISLILSQIPAF